MTIGLQGIRVSESSAAAQEAERLAGAANLAVWRFDLDELRTKSDVLAVIGRVLGMPDYFGSNWDALEEGLRDFDEGKGWLLIFEHADSILALPRQDLTVFAEILSSTAECWSVEKRTFAAHFVGGHVLNATLRQFSSTGTYG